MWFLTEIKTNKRFYLLANRAKYAVSRNAEIGDLVLAADTSISRTHAALHPAGDHVKLVDTGSKYGTFVNGNIDTNVPMAKNEPLELRENDKVRFGRLESLWRLDRILLNVLSSTLTLDEKRSLHQHLTTLNGTLLPEWSDRCTHLTVSSVSTTMKMLHSLAGTVPIVTPAYWSAYIEAARAGRTDPPDASDFQPRITEEYVSRDVSLAPNAERRRLFVHKEFVFMVHGHMKRYEVCIQLAGGRCTSLERRKMQRASLLKPHVCVVQHTPTEEQSQSQTAIDIDQVARFLLDHNLRCIPESEIGLALLYCSTRKYCNPAFRPNGEFDELRAAALLKPSTSTLLASETERPSRTAAHCSAALLEVPDTAMQLGHCNDAESEQPMPPPPPSVAYDSIAMGRQKRSASPDPCSSARSAKRSKGLAPANVAPPSAMNHSHELLDDDDDDDLLSSISQQVEIAESHAGAAAPKEPTKPAASQSIIPSTASQMLVNSSGFLPRLRATQQKTAASAATVNSTISASSPRTSADAAAASRKRAHNLLMADDSDDDAPVTRRRNQRDDDDDDIDDAVSRPRKKAASLFQFNAAPALPRRGRRLAANNTTTGGTQQATQAAHNEDSQLMGGDLDDVDSQLTSRPLPVVAELSGISSNVSDFLYPMRRMNAQRSANLSVVQPVDISLLSGWLSKSSIKCEVKDELDNGGDVEAIGQNGDRKPVLTADDGVIGVDDDVVVDRQDSKQWMAQLKVFDVRVCHVQLANRTASLIKEESRGGGGSAEVTRGGKNFKAFAKNRNYRAQSSILKTVVVVSKPTSVFDF